MSSRRPLAYGVPGAPQKNKSMTGVQVRNGIVDIDVPTDEDAKQCARLLKDQQGSTFRSLDLRRGLVTSAGTNSIAKGLKLSLIHI